MPKILNVVTVNMPYKLKQGQAKEFAREFFSKTFSDIERILPAFDNAEIDERNFILPYEFYTKPHSFEEKNRIYIEQSLKICGELIEQCLNETGFTKDEITDLIFISTSGLATPSLDALLTNKLRMNPNINRTPVWGLGCAGGVAGIAKANTVGLANPDSKILVVAVELCSLTFIEQDYSKSNFIATSLFSDGAACCMIVGDNVVKRHRTEFGEGFGRNEKAAPNIISSQSKLYYDTLDVMGWDFLDTGFKVIFSRDIPTIIKETIKSDIEKFLQQNDLVVDDIKNWIAHPGGAKVIRAYIDALNVDRNYFMNTRTILRRYGNMSSVTVLYVLKEFLENGFDNGYGLMMALGPGFSSELVLLKS